MIKVLTQIYSKRNGFDELPPIFLVAHGFGALIVLNFLFFSEVNNILSKIKAVGLFAPFFEWKNANEMYASAKISAANFNMLNAFDEDNAFNYATTVEDKINIDTVPNH